MQRLDRYPRFSRLTQECYCFVNGNLYFREKYSPQPANDLEYIKIGQDSKSRTEYSEQFFKLDGVVYFRKQLPRDEAELIRVDADSTSFQYSEDQSVIRSRFDVYEDTFNFFLANKYQYRVIPKSDV